MAIIGTWTSNNTQLFGGIKRFSQAQAEAGNYKLPTFDDVKRDSDVVSDMSVVDKYFKNMQEKEMASAYWDSTSFSKFLYASVSTNKPTRVGSYRRMAMFPEVGDAIDEICDNAIAFDENNKIVAFKLNRKFDAAAEKEIEAAAEEYLDLFNFESNMFEIVRQLVVEGEVCWENIISKDHPDAGVIGINPIPSETFDFAMDIKKNRKAGIIINLASGDQSADNKEGTSKNNSSKRVVGSMSVETLSSINNLSASEKIKNGEVCFMPFEQVTYANTGLISFDGLMVYPVLERARKAYNQLSLIEDSIIIYRLVRAPERYVFNVDTGTASRARAEQEVTKMMKRYNTKKVYNPVTGTTTSEYDPTMLVESFWFSKPAGSTGTTVDTLSSSVNLGEMKDLDYFLRKLYVSLKIPYNRYAQPEINIQRGEQINYEEYRFAKFIMRLQQCLAKGLANGLIAHLRLRGIWDRLKLRNRDFLVRFTPPTSFDIYESQKRLQLMTEKYSLMAQYQEMSKTLLQKKYLGWTEIDIEENWRYLEEEQTKAAKIRWKSTQIEQTGKVGKPGTDPFASQVVGGEDAQPDQNTLQPADQQGGAPGQYPGLPPPIQDQDQQDQQQGQGQEEEGDEQR